MYLNIQKLKPEAVIPTYSHEGDAGLDLVAISVDRDSSSLYWEYGTGLAVEIPHGFVGLLFPRSSISNTAHQLRNSVGVVDSGYRGEIKLRLRPDEGSHAYIVGDKVAQLLIFEVPILKLVEVEELSAAGRADGAFGSTGR